jgi:cellulose synthase/poly-beta-1,6-N-acetylglucosamine synthase-like glycosyltransferase
MVPCYNEEKTVAKTVHSLLAMDYPCEKLRVVVIDDGSKDGTWSVVQQFAQNPSVVLLQKKNEGSKFAALNFGLRYIKSHLSQAGIIGCLDADSSVKIDALRESLIEFTKPGVMAVVPSMVIDQPETFMQWMQKVEYELATYAKQVFSRLNTLYIAPGPFTLMRKEVFDALGEYHEAYHVEDMNLAVRMQMKGMRLSHAVNSIVYTRGPRTWPALLKQRIRWTYGFIMNVWDLKKDIFFKDSMGHVGITLPILLVMMGVSIMVIPFLVVSLIMPIIHFGSRFAATKEIIPPIHTNLFYINTSVMSMLTMITLGFLVLTIFIGKKVLLKKDFWSIDLVTTIVYPFFASWWTAQSAYNAIRGKKGAWR